MKRYLNTVAICLVMAKRSIQKFKVMHNVFDNFTERNIFRLISQGYFKGLKSPISIGKEANIFSAERDDGGIVIVKIYRLSNCNFNKMYDYIRYDPRFGVVKKQRRKVIFTWTQREYRNLLKARQAGVSVPKPYAVLDHILVQEMIGGEDVAPQLKDSHPKNPKIYFNKIVLSMKKLYRAGIVHADLSEFNILNFNETPYFIDFSQSTTTDSLPAEEYLRRDVHNICRFFAKLGMKTDEDAVIKNIKGK